MHVALVSTCTNPIDLGLRYISAYLKSHGKEVAVYFMRDKRVTSESSFAPALLDDLVRRLGGAGLIGVSVMTNTFRRARALTEAIRRAGIKAPIIWGGPHPTVAIDESLDFADWVCIGEGEQVMLELVDRLEDGKDVTTVPGLAFRRPRGTACNPPVPYGEGLDEYPFPDYDLDTHWVASGDHFETASARNLRGALHRYRILTTRGCPYACTFCMNTALRLANKARGPWVRKRSNENVLQELESAIARFPSIGAVNIVDDLFFIRSEREVEEFGSVYRERINLPIELDAFPNTVTERKVRRLTRLPVRLVSVGIQSGSPRTLRDIYHRPTATRRIAKAMNLLSDHDIPAEYHYIVNNPFESDSQRIETLRFAASHHRGRAILRIFPLQLFPGTPLFDRACREHIIGSRHESAYEYTYTGKTHVLQSGYLDIWLRVVLNLRNIGVAPPGVHRLIDLMTHPAVRSVLDRAWFGPAANAFYRIGRFLARNVVYQPMIRPMGQLGRRIVGARQARGVRTSRAPGPA